MIMHPAFNSSAVLASLLNPDLRVVMVD